MATPVGNSTPPKNPKQKRFYIPTSLIITAFPKDTAQTPAVAEGENEIHPWTAVGCCGILINHEKAWGTEAVTALRSPESTTRRKRDWCKRSDATEVPRQEMSSGGSPQGQQNMPERD